MRDQSNHSEGQTTDCRSAWNKCVEQLSGVYNFVTLTCPISDRGRINLRVNCAISAALKSRRKPTSFVN